MTVIKNLTMDDKMTPSQKIFIKIFFVCVLLWQRANCEYLQFIILKHNFTVLTTT